MVSSPKAASSSPVGLSMYEFRVKCITSEIVYKGDIYSLNRELSSCGYQLQRSCRVCKCTAVSRARCFHIEPCSTNRVFNQYDNSSNKKLTSSPRQCHLHCKTAVNIVWEVSADRLFSF